MKTRLPLFTTLLSLGVAAGAAAAQQENHQASASAADAATAAVVAQCSQVQASVTATLEAAVKRLEDARQTNSAAAMRAMTDDVQAALVQVRAQLAPCAQMQGAAAAPGGHAMPNVRQAPAAAPG